MKKVLATILAFVYLSSSMGATIHLHYCMGKLSSWSLIDHESKNCEECGMVKKTAGTMCMAAKKNCCRDEHKQIKSNQDQKSYPSEFYKFSSQAPLLVVQEPGTFNLPVFSVITILPPSNGPPLPGKLPLFLLFSNFRI